MYAILVTEPGAETETYVLGTGASTPTSATQLMLSKAEEYISEQLELGNDEAGDYDITTAPDLTVRITNPMYESTDQFVVITFEATAITEVV